MHGRSSVAANTACGVSLYGQQPQAGAVVGAGKSERLARTVPRRGRVRVERLV